MRNLSSAPFFASCILTLGMLVPSPASPATYVKVADDTLADQAGVIIEARVLEVDPSPGIGRPVTDYRMAVEQVILGDAVASPLTVRIPGGILASGIGLHVYGAPSFEEGERVLLFLTPRSDDTYRILHLMLGAFRLVEHDGESFALRRLSEAEELSLPGRVPPRDGPRNLERFRVWLEDRVRGVTRPADYFVDAPATAPPEKFTILQSSGRKIRWQIFDSGGSASFRAHADGQPGVSGGGFSQFQTALAVWRNDPDTPIDYRYGGTTTSIGGALNTFDGVNQILFDDLATPSAFDEPFNCSTGGVIAIGGPWFGGTHTFNGETFNTAVNGDIVTNKGIDCLSAGQPWIGRNRRADEVFAHELGHTLCLGHSCGDSSSPSCGSSSTLNQALMRATLHGDGRGAQLNSDDRAGIRFLYNPVNPPAAPSGLTATAVSSTQIDLAWNDNSTDEGDFDLERRVVGGSFSRIARPAANSTSYQDAGLDPSTTYTYRIRAVSDGGTSAFSNNASATTFDETPPGAPLSQVAGLIVPGFEVQVDSPTGPTTFFAVRNTSDQATTANFSFYSRIGPLDEPLRTDVHTLGPQQTKTVNVASDLTGLEITDGFATGLILITEDGNPAAPNLEGDFFRLDTDNAFATGDRLIRPTDLCLNQEIRFVDFGSGSQFRILLDQPQGDSLPSFTYSAYMENGDLIVQDEVFTSDHLTTIDVADLGIAPAFGTVVFDFANSEGGFVSAKYSAFGLFSVELNSACRD